MEHNSKRFTMNEASHHIFDADNDFNHFYASYLVFAVSFIFIGPLIKLNTNTHTHARIFCIPTLPAIPDAC